MDRTPSRTTRGRRLPLALTVALLGLAVAVAAPPGAAHARPALAAITGQVVAAADGSPLTRVLVVAYRTDDPEHIPTGRRTDDHGGFALRGLAPGVYRLCFDPTGARGGPSATGYQRQCYLRARTDEEATPIGATPGATTVLATARLATGGALAGRVTDAEGNGLGVGVALSRGGERVGWVRATDGRYRFVDLRPGTYEVCFTGDGPSDAAPAGHVSRCHPDVPWMGDGPVPHDSGEVPVNPGVTTLLPAARLALAAGISGLTPSGDVFVAAYPVGSDVAAGITRSDVDLTWSITGLDPGSYRVCAYDEYTVDKRPRSCWDDVSWPGPATRVPAAATVMTLAPGAMRSGVGFGGG